MGYIGNLGAGQQLYIENQATQTLITLMEPMKPMELLPPLKMGYMEMHMNSMEMRIGTMELRMGEQSSAQSG